MIGWFKMLFRSCSDEQQKLSAKRDAAISEAHEQSSRAITKALDSIEITQLERQAIDDLLARMDKRRHG